MNKEVNKSLILLKNKYRKFGTKEKYNFRYRVFLKINFLTARFRRSPDFIILGAQRAGTTALFNFLLEQKPISKSIKKEIHYFDNYYHKGENWYKAHFPLKSLIQRKGNLCGEASPFYLYHPFAIQRIKKDLPKIKLIILLRHPVERAYSHYKFEYQSGFENKSFSEAINLEKTRLNDEVDKIRNNEFYYSFNLQHYSYRSRGEYYSQIKNVYDYFPRNQVLIIQSEKLFAQDFKTFKKISNFLECDDFRITLFKQKNMTYKSTIPEDISKELKSHFKVHNQKLYNLINEKYNWD
jgi:hypothetical protein